MERKSRLGSILFSLVLQEMAFYGRGPTLCRWNNMSWISSWDPLNPILSPRFASPRVPKVVTTFSSLKVCLHSILTKSIQGLPISTQLSSCSSLQHCWVKPAWTPLLCLDLNSAMIIMMIRTTWNYIKVGFVFQSFYWFPRLYSRQGDDLGALSIALILLKVGNLLKRPNVQRCPQPWPLVQYSCSV